MEEVVIKSVITAVVHNVYNEFYLRLMRSFDFRSFYINTVL